MSAEQSPAPASPQQVRPGIWAIPVAIPLPGLSNVWAYAFEIPDGLLLVDSGWSSPGSLASLERGLASFGQSLADVRGAVFTHAHGDHYGLAGQVRERSGAWLALHRDDLPMLSARSGAGEQLLTDLAGWLAEAGVPDAAEQETMFPGRGAFRWDFPVAMPDVHLQHGDRIDAPGWEMEVLHVPGHSPGHVILVEHRSGVVLTGDAILPRITPNISATPYVADPLSMYLTSLKRVRRLGDLVGLPGHGDRLDSVGTRAGEIVAHHERQLAQTWELIHAGAQTVRDVAERMPWSRPWERLAGWDRRAALGEAQAHLLALEGRGALQRIAEQPLRWAASEDRTLSCVQ